MLFSYLKKYGGSEKSVSSKRSRNNISRNEKALQNVGKCESHVKYRVAILFNRLKPRNVQVDCV
jgi:hypothetical protein